ncbi:MAG: hypothetical protein C5S33_05620 [ANME-2 cluster archaeon]|nr:hypothetical protein [ANME-2 cluster archaeon]
MPISIIFTLVPCGVLGRLPVPICSTRPYGAGAGRRFCGASWMHGEQCPELISLIQWSVSTKWVINWAVLSGLPLPECRKTSILVDVGCV